MKIEHIGCLTVGGNLSVNVAVDVDIHGSECG